MGIMYTIIILGLGIPLLVIRSQYKRQQTKGKRTALLVLSVIQSIFTIYMFLTSVITIPLIAAITSNMEKSPIRPGTASGIFWSMLVIYLGTAAFGIVSLVFGYTAVANKKWTYNAMENYRFTNPGYFKTCANCGLVTEAQQPRCPRCGNFQFYQYNPYNMQNNPVGYPGAYGNTYANQNANTNTKGCANCGAVNESTAKFCSHCGSSLL